MNTALLSAALEYLIAIVLLYIYNQDKYRPALLFGLAMFSYAIAHTIAGTTLLWVKQNHNMIYSEFVKDPSYKIWETLRNVFVGLFMMLALFALTEYVSKEKRSLLYSYAILGFLAFLALRLSCVWVFHDVKHPFFALAQWVYLIPSSLLIAYASYSFYIKYKELGPLLIASSFLIYAVILPLYAILKGTPMISWWYLTRAISELLLLFGVLKS